MSRPGREPSAGGQGARHWLTARDGGTAGEKQLLLLHQKHLHNAFPATHGAHGHRESHRQGCMVVEEVRDGGEPPNPRLLELCI